MLNILIASMLAASAPSIVVSDSDALERALSTAQPHQTIALAPGAYRELAIRDVHAEGVTITSADPRHMAVIAGMKMLASSGLKFTNLELTSAGANDAWYAFRVAGSKDISFEHMNVHGDKAKPVTAQLNGFLITGSSNIRIANSNLHDLSAPIVANHNDHITIENNFFHELNKGGVEMGGTSFVVISGNEITNFHSAPNIHGDAVQIYTYGMTESAHDILVTDNIFYRGDGVAAQGIFIQDETHHLPFYNMTITKNVVIGGEWNSVYLSGASGNIRIEDNSAVSWTGFDVVKHAPTAFSGWVRLAGDFSHANLTESGNTAQVYIGTSGRAVPPPRGNKVVGALPDNGEALRKAWQEAHPGRGYPVD